MKLREFDLDLPNADREARKQFRWQVRCVCDLYTRCFSGLKSVRGWKVLVECVSKPKRLGPLDQLGVLCQEMPFNDEKFRALDSGGRKAMALDVLHAGVLQVARAEGWPIEPFEAARAGVLDLHFINEWIWPRPVASPGRQWRGYLLCSHDSDAFRAWLVVEDKAGRIVAKGLAIEEAPSEFIFMPRLGALRWIAESRVALYEKSGKESFTLERKGAGPDWVVDVSG